MTSDRMYKTIIFIEPLKTLAIKQKEELVSPGNKLGEIQMIYFMMVIE